MGKALEGAALIAGAIGMGAAAFFDPALIAVPGYLEAMGALGLGGLSMEAGAIAGALTNNRGMNITTRQAASARQVIWGQQRVGGVIIYQSTTGSKHDQYNFVIVLAGHECDSIVNLYIDGRQVFFEVGSGGNTTRNGINFGGTSASGNHTGPNGVQYDFGQKVYCEARYGDQLEGDVITGLTANDPNWAPSAGGSPWVGGCCYVYVKIEYDTNLFPGLPEFRFTVNGKNNIYDPRTFNTGFTTNWALICADVLTDKDFGLGDSSVNQAQLIAAANVCDEQVLLASGLFESRYTTNYHCDSTSAPGDMIQTMREGAAGRGPCRIGGEWFIFPAYWQGPTFQFDYGIISGTPTWQEKGYRDLFNRVNGTYVAPNYPYNIAGNLYDSNGFFDGQIQNNFSFAFQQTNYPQYAVDTLHGYADDQYLEEDGGIELPKEIGFQTVLSVAQAQRVAKINLLRNRQRGSGTFPMRLSAWQMQPLDVMEFSFPALGWSEKLLEVVGVSFEISQDEHSGAQWIGATMQVQETDPSIYDWSVSEELTIYDIPASATQTPYYPSAPTELTLESGADTAVTNTDGTVTPRIRVEWNTPADILTKQIQVQYSPLAVTPTMWIDAGLVDVSNNLTFISGVVSASQYLVRVRGIRANGAVSDWITSEAYTVSINISIQGIYSVAPAGTLIGEAYSDGTAGIEVQPFTAGYGNYSAQILPSGPYTITGLNQQQLYYVYYIDLNFTGGDGVVPIATQNTADFEGMGIGYFLIGSLVTPFAASTGSGSGSTMTNSQFQPSSYSDTGSRTTTTPTASYDSNPSTSAKVSAFATSSSNTTGNFTLEGFPSTSLTYASTLTVSISGCTMTGSSAGSVVVTVGGASTSTSLTAGAATITQAIPSGTALNTISVQFLATASYSGTGIQSEAVGPGGPGQIGSIVISVSEVYVQ